MHGKIINIVFEYGKWTTFFSETKGLALEIAASFGNGKFIILVVSTNKLVF